MNDKLTASIKKASFGFADDYLDSPAVSTPPHTVEDDSGWLQNRSVDVVRVDMLAFLLGTTHFALPLADIDTVVEAREVTPYPTRRPYMQGGIQHANQIYPVIDLGKLLQVQDSLVFAKNESRTRAKIAIVAQTGRTVGFRLDQVRRAYRIPMEDLRPLPDSVRNANRHLIDSIFDADEKVFHVISVSSIFRALEEVV